VAGGHPNVYVYCGNEPINYSDSDGISEDPSGPKGSIRVVIAHFIPDKDIPGLGGERFAGDNRGFNPCGGTYRLQHQLIITKGKDGKPIIQQKVQTGETRVTQGRRRGWKGKADPFVSKPIYYKQKDGGWVVVVSASASNPAYKTAPSLGHTVYLRFDREGNLLAIYGRYTSYPSCEGYVYAGEKGKEDYRIYPFLLHSAEEQPDLTTVITGLLNQLGFLSWILPIW
jgi:hypothetical protein